MKLIFENEEVTTKPCGLENITKPYLYEDGRVLTYEIDDNVSIEYLISDNGLKEYIVVKSYNGITQYSSEIVTNGLIIEDNQLLNGEGELKAYLGEAIVFDKEERNNTVAETDTSLIAEGRYLYTVTLTEEYLNSAEYPIRIDPSITLNTTGNIEDVSIVSTTTHSGTSTVLYVGRGTSGAALRTLMRFPNLDLSGYTVNSAKISIRDLMCENTGMYVECHEYTGNDWSESGTTTWSGCGSGMVGTLYSSLNVRYGYGNNPNDSQRYDFDITGLANKWADGTSQPSKGLIFKAPNTYESSGSKTYKTFGSINYNSNGTYYKPVLTINCSPRFNGYYTIRNVRTGSYLFTNSTNITYNRSYDADNGFTWYITQDYNHYFYVRSYTNNYYLGVENCGTTTGLDIKTFSTEDMSTHWRFYYTSSGHYRLESMCSPNSVQSISPSSLNDGANVELCTYVDDSDYIDEWDIEPCNNFLLGIIETDTSHDHTSWMTNASYYLRFTDFNTSLKYPSSNISLSDCLNKIKNSNNFAVRTHGGYGTDYTKIILSDSTDSNIDEIYLYSSDLYNFQTSTSLINLSNIRLMAFIACSTAKNYTTNYNLPNAAVQCGADYSFGFKSNINCNAANGWAELFFDYMSHSSNYFGGATSYINSQIGDLEVYYNAQLKFINDNYKDYGNKYLSLGGYLQ